jgi:hypothetical protein
LHRDSAFLKGLQGSTVLWCHILALLPVYPVSETFAAFGADKIGILVYHPYSPRILGDISIKGDCRRQRTYPLASRERYELAYT